MHIPIHPLRRRDDGLLRVLRAFARLVGLRLRHEFLAHQHLRHRLCLDRVFYKKRRKVVAHFLPHEHRVRADIDDAFALQQARHEVLDVRVDERLAAANAHHRSAAFVGSLEAIFERHQILDGGRILADASAAGAGEVAGVQRFKLENRGKFLHAANLVADDVPGDSRREC